MDQIPRASICWKPSSSGFVSLMVDGAYNSANQCIGIGDLVRDSRRAWLGGFYAGAAGGCSLYAEIQALVLGLEYL